MNSIEGAASAAKVSAAWGGVAVAHTVGPDWQQIAGFCATVYTLYMLGNAMWRHFGRRYAESRGWVRPLGREARIAEAIEEALEK